MAELREAKAWRDRFEVKFDLLLSRINRWAGILTFVAFVTPILVTLILALAGRHSA